jgi:hypothetical protein
VHISFPPQFEECTIVQQDGQHPYFGTMGQISGIPLSLRLSQYIRFLGRWRRLYEE